MEETSFFLDSSVVISAITNRNPSALLLLDAAKTKQNVVLIVNEFVIKEIRYVLDIYGLSAEEIDQAIDEVRRYCRVVKNPAREELKKLKLKDKNDKPVLASALKHCKVLVTEDSILQKEAEPLIKCLFPLEALNKIRAAEKVLY